MASSVAFLVLGISPFHILAWRLVAFSSCSRETSRTTIVKFQFTAHSRQSSMTDLSSQHLVILTSSVATDVRLFTSTLSIGTTQATKVRPSSSEFFSLVTKKKMHRTDESTRTTSSHLTSTSRKGSKLLVPEVFGTKHTERFHDQATRLLSMDV